MTTHICPPRGEHVMPCCGRTPFEVPRTDRMTVSRSLVDCVLFKPALPDTYIGMIFAT